MIRRTCFACLAVLIACTVLSSSASGQGAKKKEPLRKAGTYTGVITMLEEDKTGLFLAVPCVWHYGSITPITNGIRITRGVKTWTETFMVELPDDVKVRLPARQAVAKDGGANAKPAVKDPHPGLGGAPGTVDDLRFGQTAKVTLKRNRAGKLFATLVRVVP